MDLASSKCWVEVRPLITCELAAANFVPVLDALYNLAKPYRFRVAATNDRGVNKCQQVRFFFQFSDEQTKKQMSNIIRALLDVEVASANPPELLYAFRLDLELAKNYALPIVSGQEEMQVNLIDRLTASIITGCDTCLEVTAQADPNAALGIQKYLYEKIHPTPGLSREFLNQDLLGGLDAISGKDAQTGSTKQRRKSGQGRSDPWVRACIKNAERKLCSKLFTCQIVIQSNSLQNAQAVKNALPAAMNRFRTFKTQKKPQSSTDLRTPSRYGLRNNILCRLWWIIPMTLLLSAGGLGLFNPLNMSASAFSIEFGFLSLVGLLAVCFFAAFRKRQPIVLSTQELSQIVGLPTATEKLPIALGKVPLSRMQLRSETPTKQTNENIALSNKEEHFQELGLSTSRLRAAVVPEEKETPANFKMDRVVEEEM
ncbi:MAG: hypothetical protein LBI79_05580 [Nitrososphaerota archaeon]|jgi:hypothetical protein|nr:hypothetical protein [Nitrososphaerota archaeon]